MLFVNILIFLVELSFNPLAYIRWRFYRLLKNKIPDYKSHKIYFDFGTLGLDSLYEPYQLLVDSIMIENGYTKNKNWVTKKYFDEDHNEDYWKLGFIFQLISFFN